MKAKRSTLLNVWWNGSRQFIPLRSMLNWSVKRCRNLLKLCCSLRMCIASTRPWPLVEPPPIQWSSRIAFRSGSTDPSCKTDKSIFQIKLLSVYSCKLITTHKFPFFEKLTLSTEVCSRLRLRVLHLRVNQEMPGTIQSCYCTNVQLPTIITTYKGLVEL